MELKKLISIVVPVYNEEEMIYEIYNRTVRVMEEIPKYDFEIVYFDDGSKDNSRALIESLCKKDPRVKAVFYLKNFGYLKNTFYSLQQSAGDAAVLLHADLQNPPEVIPQLIAEWEKGSTVVVGIKNKSKENKLMYFLRTVFYFVMNAFFGMNLVPHATDFGLFDKSFCTILKESQYFNPFLREIINAFSGEKTAYIHYTQDKRQKGKTKFNFSKYYDFAVCGIINQSQKLPRRFLLFSIICILLSLTEFFVFLLPSIKCCALADIIDSVILRVILLFIELMAAFISIISEYVIGTAQSTNKRPIIVEEKRINY